MDHKLIDELLDAFARWAELTDNRPRNLADWVLLYSGGLHVKPQGGTHEIKTVDDLQKPMSEILGQYTIDQVHSHLVDLVERQGWLEDVVVRVVVTGISDELRNLAQNADSTMSRLRNTAIELRGAANASPEHRPLLDWYAAHYDVSSDIARRALQRMAEFTERRVQELPAELPTRQAELRAWEAVSSPLITPERLARSREEQYMQTVDSGWSDKYEDLHRQSLIRDFGAPDESEGSTEDS